MVSNSERAPGVVPGDSLNNRFKGQLPFPSTCRPTKPRETLSNEPVASMQQGIGADNQTGWLARRGRPRASQKDVRVFATGLFPKNIFKLRWFVVAVVPRGF
jgi:hypothetical protein